jgi:hypothetical protein
MREHTTVRIKGLKWEALASRSSDKADVVPSEGVSPLTLPVSPERQSDGDDLLLGLAIRHFRELELTSIEARKLASGLQRCLHGEPVDVGPVGLTSRNYQFRKQARSISIRVGEGCMRLPLRLARALVEPLRYAMRPKVLANTG